jgi:hypothetical protein
MSWQMASLLYQRLDDPVHRQPVAFSFIAINIIGAVLFSAVTPACTNCSATAAPR